MAISKMKEFLGSPAVTYTTKVVTDDAIHRHCYYRLQLGTDV